MEYDFGVAHELEQARVTALLAQIGGFGGETYADDLSKCGCGHPPPYLEPPRARGWVHAPAKRKGRRVSATGAVRSLTRLTVAAAVSGSAAASDYADHAQPSVHIPAGDGPILLEFEVFFKRPRPKRGVADPPFPEDSDDEEIDYVDNEKTVGICVTMTSASG